MDQLKNIIADLKAEDCVLIIGPDIIDFGDNTFFEAMCDDLVSNSAQKKILDIAPQYIFANEELLQLMPSEKETTLLRMMEEFYKKQAAFDIPLTKISQLPFHLIISLMPDDRLQKLFEKQDLDYSYGHYPRAGAHKPIEKPTKKKPLIYNLMGDFKNKDAIITFENFFSFLSNIMGDNGLPELLKETLQSAGSFVFLGVHFEKWYVQLLLRLIISKGKNNYTILKSRSNNDVSTFIARRLELEFLKTEPLQFLNDLYKECGELDLLKTINTKFKARVFISYSSIDSAIAEKIEQELMQQQVEVIRDINSSHAGQKIEDFISTIKSVDCVLLIASKNSLRSAWVCKEIMTTLESGKLFMPCYVDRSFLDDGFWEEIKDSIKEKLSVIGKKISERGADPIDDLLAERHDWTAFNSNLANIKTELNRGIAKSLMPGEFENNIQQVIQYIIKNKHNA